MSVTYVAAVYVVFALLCYGILFALAVVAALIFVFGKKYDPQYHIEIINERSELAEGPYWDQVNQRLYYVDMWEMLINSYNPVTGIVSHAKVVSDKKPVSLVVRVKDTEDKFVIALKGSLALIKWNGANGAKVEPIHLLDIVDDPTSGSRCNDGKADPSNRLWVGTMGAQTKSNPNGNQFEKDKGELFRINFDGRNTSKTIMERGLQIANGLEWSPDNTMFYLVDSLTFNVTKYQYNDQEGTIKKLSVLYDLKADGLIDKPNSLPDGMTIDNQGFLWIAVYGTGKVIRVDPKTGKKVFELQLNRVLQPTSVCFGGEYLDTLYVTSAHVDWTAENEREYPQSGNLFKITNLDVKGLAPSRPVSLPKSLLEKSFKKNDQLTLKNQSVYTTRPDYSTL